MTDPLILIRHRSGKKVREKNETTPDNQGEEPIEASRLPAGSTPGAGTVKGESAEMLRGEVPGHPGIVDDHKTYEPLRPRPRQRMVRGEKERKTSYRDQNREHDEADRLGPQERAIRFRAVGEVSTAKPVTKPEQGGETEVEKVQR